jgi:hypothetical protein
MTTHTRPAAYWWDRYERLMWTVSASARHWQATLYSILFLAFAVIL